MNNMNQTWVEILGLCDEVEALLRDAAPVADDYRLQRIRFLTARLCGRDTYITEKANRLASQAGVYFSARKHQKVPGGADGVMAEMRYRLLGSIREQAHRYLRQA
jgi:hypothetical protein